MISDTYKAYMELKEQKRSCKHYPIIVSTESGIHRIECKICGAHTGWYRTKKQAQKAWRLRYE